MSKQKIYIFKTTMEKDVEVEFKFQMGIMKSVIGKLEPFSTIKECFVRMLNVFNCLRK